jgi:hypothetical protein
MGRFTINLIEGASCMYEVKEGEEFVGTANHVDGIWTLYNWAGRQINSFSREPNQGDFEEMAL